MKLQFRFVWYDGYWWNPRFGTTMANYFNRFPIQHPPVDPIKVLRMYLK